VSPPDSVEVRENVSMMVAVTSPSTELPVSKTECVAVSLALAS